MNRISQARGLPLAHQAGVHWLRRNGLEWRSVEPEPGARQWKTVAGLEAELRAAHAAGLHIILVVRQTPSWAQKVPGHSCGPVAPEALDDLAQFMTDAVTRYKDPPYSIKYWELGNEPDVDPALVGPDSQYGCWGDQNDEFYGGRYYAQMLQAVYPAIKAADPEAQVLIGGLLLDKEPARDENPNPPGRFFEGILRGGGGDSFDIVSFHGYVHYDGQPDNWEMQNPAWRERGGIVAGKTDFLREVLSAYGYDKPLMLTEAGLLCTSCSSPPSAEFLAAQAAYVPQLYVRSMVLGLVATVWYTLDGPGWREAALLTSEQRPRPALHALRTVSTFLEGAYYAGPPGKVAGLEGYAFQREGTEVWTLWSPDGTPVSIMVPATMQQAYDLFGIPLSLEGNKLAIGFNPVYLQVLPGQP